MPEINCHEILDDFGKIKLIFFDQLSDSFFMRVTDKNIYYRMNIKKDQLEYYEYINQQNKLKVMDMVEMAQKELLKYLQTAVDHWNDNWVDKTNNEPPEDMTEDQYGKHVTWINYNCFKMVKALTKSIYYYKEKKKRREVEKYFINAPINNRKSKKKKKKDIKKTKKKKNKNNNSPNKPSINNIRAVSVDKEPRARSFESDYDFYDDDEEHDDNVDDGDREDDPNYEPSETEDDQIRCRPNGYATRSESRGNQTKGKKRTSTERDTEKKEVISLIEDGDDD